MKKIFVSTLIIICLGASSLKAEVLVKLSLQAPAYEYDNVKHPCTAAKETSFNVPGAGFLRITYTDASYNNEAEGGLQWRRVPGATNYWKAPGTGITSLKEPDPPVSGTQYTFTNITKVDGAMHNVGVVLTPRIRITWVGGGYQYQSDLHVQVEWSPQEFQLKQDATITTEGRNTQTPSPGNSQITSQPQKIFNNGNGSGVRNAPLHPTVITLNHPFFIESIVNYHYNNGQGDAPGTISLVSANGEVYGPWQAVANPPDGNDPRKYWTVLPQVILPPGTYTVVDSNPLTWAQNDQSDGKGMCWIVARQVESGNDITPIPSLKGGSTHQFCEGELIRQRGTQAVYVIKNGVGRLIPDAETFNARGYSWKAVKDISSEYLHSVPEGTPIPSVK